MRRACWTAGLAVAVLFGAGRARATDPKVIDKAIEKAVDKGVAALKQFQNADGSWPHGEIGATALAGLTLLECGVRPEDKTVSRAADAVRKAAVNLRHTYSLSLAILFLDRLGDPGDVRLIESMTLRLLGGQTPSGGWSYLCPEAGAGEIQKLAENTRERLEWLGRREPPPEGRTAPKDKEEGKEKEMPKRTVKDLPKEIQDQLPLINRMVALNDGGGLGGFGRDDNSNTQFATLGLWVGRRYGFPVEEALGRIDARFRASQNGDGGWSYMSTPGGPRHGMNSSAAMTAAGLLGLAVAHGAAAELKDGKERLDPAKDANLKAGLIALSTAVGHPAGKHGGVAAMASGKSYYFLWSLERVAMALDLQAIGGKDWYTWGAEIIVANQRPDGTWVGEYGPGGVDTCFALLFLRRSNLAGDLTAHFRGKLKEAGKSVLRAGGVGGDALKGGPPPSIQPGIDASGKNTPVASDAIAEPIVPREAVRPAPRTPEEAAVRKLSDELVRARPEKRREAIDQLREGKGVKYTEALADAVSQLSGDDKRKVREALADRLSRMKTDTLGKYLQDELPEIRRAAALACAMKDNKVFVPNLVEALTDAEPSVVRAVHAALKELTGQDFGPTIGADKEDVKKAVEAWQAWWAKKQK